MDYLKDEEEQLIRMTLEKLSEIRDVRIYGELDPQVCERVASISFNIEGLDHGLVAAALNDYFNISVRNECFCAHPYVKEMIMDDLLESVKEMEMEEIEKLIHMKQGMVRASFAMYSTLDDANALIEAVEEMVKRKEYYRSLYHIDEKDNYVHNTFKFNRSEEFSILQCIGEITS